jgi:hypothetical protein
MQIPFGIQI